MMTMLNTNKCKVCRSVGKKLYLKGSRCFSEKCPISHGRGLPGKPNISGRITKLSLFKEQWIEKKKILSIYGLGLGELKRYFLNIKTSDTDRALVARIESRLDNVVFRGGFASNRSQARQIVSHGFVKVNDMKVDVPSYCVYTNDIISIDSSFMNKNAKNIFSARSKVVSWIEKTGDFSFKVISEPYAIEQPTLFSAKLVIEFLSR